MAIETYVGNEIELSMLKSAFSDIQYGASTVALLGGPRGCGKTSLVRRMIAKAGISGAEPYRGNISGLGAELAQKSLIWLEDIHLLPADSLLALSETCKKIASGPHPGMIIITYTAIDDGSINAPLMAFVSELKTSLGDGLLYIEMKPLKLADVHFLISKQYEPNCFDTNFANQLHKASEGNPMAICRLLAMLEQEGKLQNRQGAWQVTATSEMLEQMADSLKESCEAAGMEPKPEDSATSPEPQKQYLSTADIEGGLQELESLAQGYKMAKALAMAGPLIEAARQRVDDSDSRARHFSRAVAVKCRALTFLGLYGECESAAREALAMPEYIAPEHKASITALMAQAIGYQSRYSESFTQFDIAISQALACHDHGCAGMIYCLKVPFLLEYPLLSKVLDACERGQGHCQKSGDDSHFWELELYRLYYLRYMSKLSEAMERSADVLKYFREQGDAKMESRTLNVIGLLHSSLCKFSKAEECFGGAIGLLKSIDDKVGLIGVYNNMGHLKFDTGQYDSSIRYFKKALDISSSIGSKGLMLVSYTGIGTSLIYLGKSAEAGEYLGKGVEMAGALENKSPMAYAQSALGDLYSHDGDAEKALEKYLMALEIDRGLEDTPSIVCDLTNIANAYIAAKDFDNGIKYLEGVKDEMPDYASNMVIQAAIDNTFGNLYAEKGDAGKALEHYRMALETNKKCGDHICTSLNYYNMGLLYIDQSNYDEAIGCFQNAVKQDRLSGDKMLLAQHLQRLAYCQRTIDEPQQSLKCNMEAASLFRQLGLMEECAASLKAAGDDDRTMKSFQNAEKLLSEAAGIFEQSQNFLELAETYTLIAILHSDTRMPQKASEYLRLAISTHISKNLDDYERFSKITQQMELLCSKFHNSEKEIQYLKEAREKCSPLYYIEITLTIAKILENTCSSKAEGFYMEAATRADSIDDFALKCDIICEAAGYMSENGKSGTCAEMVKNAIKEGEESGESENRLPLARLKVCLADSLESLGNYSEALEKYKEALEVFEEMKETWDAACIYNNIGFIFDNMSRCSEAAIYYHKAFLAYKELDNYESIVKNLYNEALMMEHLNNFERAGRAYLLALEYIDEEENPSYYADTALNAANCMSTFESSDKVLKMAEKAYRLFKSEEIAGSMLQCLEFMAIYCFDNKIQAAKSYLSAISGIKGDSRTLIMAENTAASVCFYMNDIEGCMEHFHKAVAISTEIDSWQAVALCNTHIASKMGNDSSKYGILVESNGKTRTIAEFCIECLQFSIKIAESENLPHLKSKALEMLSAIYWKSENTSEAMQALDQAIQMQEIGDDERLSMMLCKAVHLKDSGNPEMAQELIKKTIIESEAAGQWETRLLGTIWLCYWKLQENPEDSFAMQTLKLIGQKSRHLLLKVPGLADFLEKL